MIENSIISIVTKKWEIASQLIIFLPLESISLELNVNYRMYSQKYVFVINASIKRQGKVGKRSRPAFFYPLICVINHTYIVWQTYLSFYHKILLG